MGREDLELVGRLRPEWIIDSIGREISTRRPAEMGVPLEKVKSPISRSGRLTDETLYDSPTKDAVYFVPRWRVTHPPGGVPQIVMQQSPTGWTLTVTLEGYAAPSIAEQLANALPLPADYSCLVGYNLAPAAGSGGAVVREVVAVEVGGSGLTLTATFGGTDPAGLSQLYSAMTEDQHGTVFIVRRTVTAAIELRRPKKPGGTFPPIITLPPIIRNPIKPVVVKPAPIVVRPIKVKPPRPPIVDHRKRPSIVPGRVGPILRKGGRRSVGAFADDAEQEDVHEPLPLEQSAVHVGSHRRVVHATPLLRGGWIDRDVLFPDRIIDMVIDPTRPRRKHYVERSVELDDIQPFVYPSALYPSVYAGVAAESTSFALRRVEILFEGQPYPYYQDVGTAATFYYLPDAFRLGRSVAVPHTLMLEVSAADTDGTMENVKVRFGFSAVPFTSQSRLEAAATSLRAHAPGPYPPGIDGPQLMPLVVAQSALRLSLLLAGESGPAGSGAILSLRSGIVSSEILSIPQFQTVYNALFGGIALVSGSLEVLLGGPGAPSDTVPVDLRVANAWGPVVDVIEHEADGSSVSVTIVNMIESPVRVEAIEATMTDDGVAVPASVTVVDRALPVQLAPGEAATARVEAVVPVDGGGELLATVAPRVAVLPDPHAVWLTVFGHSAPMPVKKAVSVRVPADIFAERAGSNGHPGLKGVTVEFEAGVAAAFDSTDAPADGVSPFITKAVAVPVGLEGYVIASVAPGTYHYRVAAITASNEIVRDAASRMSNLDILDVTLPAFAAESPTA